MTDEIKKLLVNPSSTLKDAMAQLDATEKKILFVADDKHQLVGTITDGDIRRWILSDGVLQDRVEKICNHNPVTVDPTFDLRTVRELMMSRSISCIPVVDEKNHIKDVLFWERIFGTSTGIKQKPNLNIPVVIMAGGKGTRLDPFTKILPKPLIPIGDRTVVEIIIESFTDFGVNEFILSVNHKAKIIKSYFEDADPPYSLEYISEAEPLGTAGSLRYLQDRFVNSFIVTNCDILIQTDYADLLHFHKSKNDDITIVASVKHFNIPYGICEIENGGTLLNIREKPQYDFLVNTGMYVVKPTVLSLIPENSMFHFTDLIEAVRKNNGKVSVFPINESGWLDTGEWAEYKKVISRFKEDLS